MRAEYHQMRGVIHFPMPYGGRAILDMDVEQYAAFVTVYDRATFPKLGGVRFVDRARKAHAQAIKDDPRTPKQLGIDAIIHLLAAGATADDSVLLGFGAPTIRITVAESALETGVGLGRIDGQPLPISIDTVKRLLCDAATIRITVDAFGHPLESETEQRLFSKRQGDIMAAKFGGCMDPDCDRPPAWCEKHHIIHWKRDGGKTFLSNGILLCKYHHLKYHNDGTEIVLDNHGQYWKIPPTSTDPTQTPVHMPFKTRNLNDLYLATARAKGTPTSRDAAMRRAS